MIKWPMTIQWGNDNGAFLLTLDKDFGELVFRQGLVHAGVILIRLAGLHPSTMADFVATALAEHDTKLLNTFASFLLAQFEFASSNRLVSTATPNNVHANAARPTKHAPEPAGRGQTKLSARFNESGQRPIATLPARQVIRVFGREIHWKWHEQLELKYQHPLDIGGHVLSVDSTDFKEEDYQKLLHSIERLIDEEWAFQKIKRFDDSSDPSVAA